MESTVSERIVGLYVANLFGRFFLVNRPISADSQGVLSFRVSARILGRR
jgi:hypothetical protein